MPIFLTVFKQEIETANYHSYKWIDPARATQTMVFCGIGLSSKWKPVVLCLLLILPEFFSDGVPNATGAVFFLFSELLDSCL